MAALFNERLTSFHYIESTPDFRSIRDIFVYRGLEGSPMNFEVLYHWDPLNIQCTGNPNDCLIVLYDFTYNDEALLRLGPDY